MTSTDTEPMPQPWLPWPFVDQLPADGDDEDGPLRLPHSPKFLRLLHLMRLLEHATVGWTYEQLAEKLDCSTRTIRRCLETLRACGAEIPLSASDDDVVFVKRLTWPRDRKGSVS